MSIFAKSLKTIKTDITGKELHLKLNVAVWLILDKEYGIPQGKWAEAFEENRIVTMSKFVASVFRANKYEVTLEEVMENISQYELEKFINTYNDLVFEEIVEELDLEGETEDKPVEGK